MLKSGLLSSLYSPPVVLFYCPGDWDVSMYRCTGSFSPVVLWQPQSSSSALQCTPLASPMPVLLGSAALPWKAAGWTNCPISSGCPCAWVGPTHRPSRLVHSRAELLTLPCALLSVPSCRLSSVPTPVLLLCTQLFTLLGSFYYFFFHKTNLLVSHLSFLTLLSLTSVEFLRFCCVPALSLLISYAVVCFQLHLWTISAQAKETQWILTL